MFYYGRSVSMTSWQPANMPHISNARFMLHIQNTVRCWLVGQSYFESSQSSPPMINDTKVAKRIQNSRAFLAAAAWSLDSQPRPWSLFRGQAGHLVIGALLFPTCNLSSLRSAGKMTFHHTEQRKHYKTIFLCCQTQRTNDNHCVVCGCCNISYNCVFHAATAHKLCSHRWLRTMLWRSARLGHAFTESIQPGARCIFNYAYYLHVCGWISTVERWQRPM